MKITELEGIKRSIFDAIGVKVDGRVDKSGPRQGLVMWFANYTSQEGPRFCIRPAGLKRHRAFTKFGDYSQDCIDHIRARANNEDYQTAIAHISTLKSLENTNLENNGGLESENLDSDFKISAFRKKLDDPHQSEEIIYTVKNIIVPMMAAMAELIGYEDIDNSATGLAGDGDGKVTWTLTKRRERNPRNRLLCISIHGRQCGVCGFMPNTFYPEASSEILEVHHIEPLSEAEGPKVYNPATDLIPLCPNCHRAIHRVKPAMKPEELKQLLNI